MQVTQFDDPSKLREHIELAFRDVLPPAQRDTAYKDDWDYEAIVVELGFYTREPPPVEVLEEHAKSLAALTPEAFAFFLPKYMIYSVDHIDSEVTDILIFNLQSAITSTTDYWKSRLGLLTHEHRKAICGYVSFVVPKWIIDPNSDDINELVRFWCVNDDS